MKLFVQNIIGNGRMVFLDNNDQIVADREMICEEGKKHPDLVNNLNTFIVQNNWQWSNIDHLFTIVGPGDFTPVRTMCVMMNTLADELNAQRSIIDLDQYAAASSSSLLQSTLKSAQAVERFEPEYIVFLKK